MPSETMRAKTPRKDTMKTTCSVAGCGRSVFSGGLCRTHYRRGRQHVPRPYAQVPPVRLVEIEQTTAALARANECYERVIGVTLRIRWRAEIRELEDMLARMIRQYAAQQKRGAQRTPRKTTS